MKFEADDLDWAMGELTNLFVNANQTGIFPHLLDPQLFYSGWAVINHQPFKVRSHCRQILLFMLTEPYWKTYSNGTVIRLTTSAKRYENSFTY